VPLLLGPVVTGIRTTHNRPFSNPIWGRNGCLTGDRILWETPNKGELFSICFEIAVCLSEHSRLAVVVLLIDNHKA
jgi:hypothetical protein